MSHADPFQMEAIFGHLATSLNSFHILHHRPYQQQQQQQLHQLPNEVNQSAVIMPVLPSGISGKPISNQLQRYC